MKNFVNFAVSAALERLSTEEDPFVAESIISDALSILMTMLPGTIEGKDVAHILQVGCRLGAAAAYAQCYNTNAAIKELQSLNVMLTETGDSDG